MTSSSSSGLNTYMLPSQTPSGRTVASYTTARNGQNALEGVAVQDNTPQQGRKLPEVEFVTEDGSRVAAADLVGQQTVLYFYPKDDTPGCTKEACAFRDSMEDYGAAGIKVYGVSLD